MIDLVVGCRYLGSQCSAEAHSCETYLINASLPDEADRRPDRGRPRTDTTGVGIVAC